VSPPPTSQLFHPDSQLFLAEPGKESVTAPNPAVSSEELEAQIVSRQRQGTRELLRIIARLLTNDVFSFVMLWVDSGNVHNPSWLGLVSPPSLPPPFLLLFVLCSLPLTCDVHHYFIHRQQQQLVNILGATMAFKDPTHMIINVVVHLLLALLALVVMGAQWEVGTAQCRVQSGVCSVLCCVVLCCVVLRRQALYRCAITHASAVCCCAAMWVVG
jgi:hypothetical protein